MINLKHNYCQVLFKIKYQKATMLNFSSFIKQVHNFTDVNKISRGLFSRLLTLFYSFSILYVCGIARFKTLKTLYCMPHTMLAKIRPHLELILPLSSFFLRWCCVVLTRYCFCWRWCTSPRLSQILSKP